jgi:hypothetical protein
MPEYTTTEAAFLMAHNERIRELEAENERLRKKVAIGHTVERSIYEDHERYQWIKRISWDRLEKIKKSYIDAPGQPTFDEKIDKAMKDE